MQDISNLRLTEQEELKETEKMLLGILLAEGNRFDEVADVSPDIFTVYQHRQIFEVMLKLYRQDIKIDPTSVNHHFAGDASVVNDMLGSSFLRSEFENCARVLQDAQLERQLRELFKKTDADLCKKKPISEVIDFLQKEVLDLGTGDERGSKAIADFVDELLAEQKGVTTGYPDLDDFTLLENGTMTVLAARPGMGKTAFALGIAANIAKTGRSVLFFSLEMSARQVLQRMAAMCERIPLENIRFNRPTDEEKERKESGAYLQLPIVLNDQSSWTPHSLRREIRRQKHKFKIEVVVIDYLGLLRYPGTENRVQEVTEISRELKSIAKDLDLPILALHQLNRAPENRDSKKPCLADLRDSGAIEQDADMVWFPFRPAAYGLKQKVKAPESRKTEEVPYPETHAELIVAKQRQGPCKRIALTWLGEHACFESAAKSSAEYGNSRGQ